MGQPIQSAAPPAAPASSDAGGMAMKRRWESQAAKQLGKSTGKNPLDHRPGAGVLAKFAPFNWDVELREIPMAKRAA